MNECLGIGDNRQNIILSLQQVCFLYREILLVLRILHPDSLRAIVTSETRVRATGRWNPEWMILLF